MTVPVDGGGFRCLSTDWWCLSRESCHPNGVGTSACAAAFRRAAGNLQAPMTPRQPGRSAPWAKALGTVLLTVLAVFTTYHAIGTHRQSQRKEAAFEDTREDARRFVDNVLAREEGFPATRQQMENVYGATIGRSRAWLHVVRFGGGRTRVVAQFSRSYDHFPRLFGPADTDVSRCFTIELPSRAADPGQVWIIAHGSDESCADVSA